MFKTRSEGFFVAENEESLGFGLSAALVECFGQQDSEFVGFFFEGGWKIAEKHGPRFGCRGAFAQNVNNSLAKFGNALPGAGDNREDADAEQVSEFGGVDLMAVGLGHVD